MSSPVEQIKERLDLVEVVSGYLRLDKAGANYRARCPFHQEKTPSFFVSPSRQSYHCFGCQRGGDIFTFVQEIEGLDFPGALKTLAERAGVELRPSDRDQRVDDQRERLLRLMEAATAYYEEQLAVNPAAQAYLAGRGVTPETIYAWRLGWAENNWRQLTDYLLHQGFSEVELVESGMAGRSEKSGERIYDRFRGRIQFPLFDNAGRVVAFSGRIFESKEGVAKYLNSPQTVLYDKSRLLYGYHRAKMAIRQAGVCVLVEGQLDLLLSHQTGVTNTVAVSGTALTEKHFAEPIKRLSRVLVMAFDGDAAGVAASRRAVEIGLDQNFEVRLVALPSGQDPADLIKQNPVAWPLLVSQAKHVIDFFLRLIDERQLPPRERAHAVVAEILPLVARLHNQIDQAYFVTQASHLAGMTEEVMGRELRRILASQSGGVITAREMVVTPAGTSRQERIEEKLLGLWWWRQATLAPLLTTVWPDGLLERLAEKKLAKKDSLLLEVELSYADYSPVKLEAEVAALLQSWQTESDSAALLLVKEQLREAERRGDELATARCLSELQKISQRLKNLINK